MADASDEDKDEAPTGKKREEGRKEGQVATSKDLNTLSLMVGGGSAAVICFEQSSISLATFMQSTLGDLTQPMGAPLYERMVETYWISSFPVMVTGVIVAIAFGVAQSKGYCSLEKLTNPNLDNLINPLKGIKGLLFTKQAAIQFLF